MGDKGDAVKERPILFSGPMVRAILDGRKTQTRRIVKPQPNVVHAIYGDASIDTNLTFRRGDGRIRCPYGIPGDRLWVREAKRQAFYRASTTTGGDENRQEYIRLGHAYQWRPSIHMPRWASHITLEIESVRVERLQEITEEDARAEGWHPGDGQGPIEWYEDLWQSINGPGSWDANPWVWVIQFNRVAS